MVHIVQSSESESGRLFIEAVAQSFERAQSGTERVAFDCEGINLSRIGTVELISICFSSLTVFLVDFGGTPDRIIVQEVKRLFESNEIFKIIHDCRMDSDVLFHRHDITLQHVHDTSVYHYVITGQQDKGLNDVLVYNQIEANEHRDKSVYQRNPNFWADRPLSATLIDWATSDVDKLFELAQKQLNNLNDRTKLDADNKSNEFASSARSMQVVTNLRVNKPGLFIGPRGSNIQSLQRRTRTIMYQERPKPTWFVYYPDDAALAAVRRAMNGCWNGRQTHGTDPQSTCVRRILGRTL
jgi:exonuclease 3'-5' domain-containing protein 1